MSARIVVPINIFAIMAGKDAVNISCSECQLVDGEAVLAERRLSIRFMCA